MSSCIFFVIFLPYLVELGHIHDEIVRPMFGRQFIGGSSAVWITEQDEEIARITIDCFCMVMLFVLLIITVFPMGTKLIFSLLCPSMFVT